MPKPILVRFFPGIRSEVGSLGRLFSTEATSDSWNLPPKSFQNSRRHKSEKTVDLVRVEGEILYGVNPVQMALQAGKRKFHRIYFNEASKRTSEIVQSGKQRGVRCVKVDRQVLNQLARHSSKEVGVHQGVCADVEKLWPEIILPEDLDKGPLKHLYLLVILKVFKLLF